MNSIRSEQYLLTHLVRESPSKPLYLKGTLQNPSKYLLPPSPADIPIKELFLTLSRPHYFLKHSHNGCSSLRKVYFSSNLSEIHIEKGQESLKLLRVPDILSVEYGFTRQTLTTLRKLDDNSRVYGFQLTLSSGVLELSSNSSSEREKWVVSTRRFIEFMHSWRSPNGLRSYLDSLIQIQSLEKNVVEITHKQKRHEKDVGYLKKERQALRSEVVAEVVGNLVAQTEITTLEAEMRKLTSENLLLSATNKDLLSKNSQVANQLASKRMEIQNISESVSSLDTHLQSMYHSMRRSYIEELPRIWLKIMEFFTLHDLLRIRLISVFYRNIVKKFLRVKGNWKRLALVGLSPRRLFWNQYMNTFYYSRLSIRCEVPGNIVSEMKKDIARLPDMRAQVETVLKAIYSACPDIGYCQGMQQVAHFLVKRLGDPWKTAELFLSLTRPPYFMGEM